MSNALKTGSVQGTGASLDVVLGFAPDYVEVINDTAGDKLEWFNTMADASAYKRVAVGTGTKITVGGISKLNGAAGQGFTIGTDAVNANGVTLRYRAGRNID